MYIRFHVTYALFLSDFNDTWNFLDRFSKKKKAQIPSFMEIHPVGAELSHADRRTDRHDEVNSRFSQFCESASLCSTDKCVSILSANRKNGGK